MASFGEGFAQGMNAGSAMAERAMGAYDSGVKRREKEAFDKDVDTWSDSFNQHPQNISDQGSAPVDLFEEVAKSNAKSPATQEIEQHEVTGIGDTGQSKPVDSFKPLSATMSPAAQIKWRMDQQQENTKYQRELDKLGAVEEYRAKRENDREDRRDDRLDKRLDAQSTALEKRLAAQPPHGGITQAQQRGNEEIELARQSINGLSPDEIQKRTAKFTQTGRENPNFDATLARNIGLAQHRKIGDDPHFDNRMANAQQPQQPKQQPTVNDRFASDTALAGKGFKLGAQTPKGYEVRDASGKLIGHYQ